MAYIGLQDSRYDLLLMDMEMPGLNSLEPTQQIRRLPGMACLPIIAMAANAFNEDRARCLAAGMNDYLSKPVDSVLLYGLLLKWLNLAHGQPEKS